MRTTKRSNNLLVAILIGAVNLCAAYSIKEPGTYTASFSKSSSSASAFSQSSSSSYTVNGNIAPGDVESLKEALKSGAVAHASAGAAAGAAAVSVADATASAGAVASANAGSVADGSDYVTVDGSGHEQGVTVSAESNVKGSGCSGGTSCGKDKDSNSISDSSSATDSGSYKVIASDKYATGYSNGDSTNYAVSGQYIQPAQNTILEGCVSCKGPFPGPNGSIHTYKPAVSNPHSAPAPAVQPIASTPGSFSHQHGSAVTNNLPGPSGSIYQSKPASGYSGQSATEAQTQYNSGSAHVSPGLVATLPGPSGSIYDSKPASAVASAGAYADTAVVPSHPQVVPVHPQVLQPSAAPSCSDSNCGSNPSLSDIIAILPGPSGSIHDSKPVSGTSNKTSGSSSNSYSTSGSVSHTPATPVVKPSCSFAPGSGSTNCGGNSDSAANTAYSGAGSVTYNPYAQPTSDASKHTSGSTIVSDTPSEAHTGVYNGAGSVTNIPASHPVVGPVCNYSPGSSNKCVSSGSSTAHTEAGSGATSEYEAGSAVLTPSIHPQLPSPGTYYINKPTSDIEPPRVGPVHSFAGQIPCSDSKCGNIQKEASQAHSGDCGSVGGCGGTAAASQGSAASGIIYETKNTNAQYSTTNHDAAHISGGVVFQNEDGSYSNLSKGTRPIHKNSDEGGYAVSSNAAGNIGVLIGPGTGHLPIEADHKSFGTQGTFVNSDALNKKTSSDKINSFASSSAIAHSSEHTTTSNTGLGTDVTIQKVDGTLVTPVDATFNQSPCVVEGNCGNTNVVTDIGTGYINAPSSASISGNGYHNGGTSTLGSATETGYSNVGSSVTSGLEIGYNNAPTSTIVTNTINSNAAPSTSANPPGIDYNHVPLPSSGSITGTGYNNAASSTITGSHSGTGYIKTTGSSTGIGSISAASDHNKGSSASSGSAIGTGYNTAAISSSGALTGTSYTNIEHDHKQYGTPVKVNCAGPFCKPGSTQVYIIEESPQYGHRHHGDDSGYATGQVLINQGQNVLDITNSGSHGFASNYAGSNGGSYFPPIRGYSSGCGSEKCGAFGGYGGLYHKPASSYSAATGGGYEIPTSGGFLEGLFGKGGLSGNNFNGGRSQAAAYSSSGAYGGASAGSYASASAGATASAGAYAGSY